MRTIQGEKKKEDPPAPTMARVPAVASAACMLLAVLVASEHSWLNGAMGEPSHRDRLIRAFNCSLFIVHHQWDLLAGDATHFAHTVALPFHIG